MTASSMARRDYSPLILASARCCPYGTTAVAPLTVGRRHRRRALVFPDFPRRSEEVALAWSLLACTAGTVHSTVPKGDSMAPRRHTCGIRRLLVSLGLMTLTMVTLQGCAALPIAAFSIVAGTGAGAGVGHTLDSITYKTF